MAAYSSRSSFWLIGLAVVLMVGAGVLGWRLAGVSDSEAQEGAAPRPPAVELAVLGGGTVDLADFEGEVVVGRVGNQSAGFDLWSHGEHGHDPVLDDNIPVASWNAATFK